MSTEKGNISIHTENIFPIIKKWLYSEKDIFLRELVSNASDAINKVKKLSTIGEAKLAEDYKARIDVAVSKKNGTITIMDNGIGMTADEVRKYINQIAFSGAMDFIEKYKDKTDDQQIIGHFGLGFYSSFMVASKVEIRTLSHVEGSEAVLWESNGDTEYQMGPAEKTSHGSEITLYMADDSKEFLDTWKVQEVLKKYFAFLPVEIFCLDADAEKTTDTAKKTETEDAEADELDAVDKGEKPLNNTSPLWLKNPRDCTDEEYKAFYRDVFMDFNDPLFWIHINMDYPFNMKGIIYFPKLKHEFETSEGKIKLYYNQVYVADNIKEVIPEFLMLLKGTLDCPDLPLNVSRSFLQNEGYVHKISAHITKKVADKLQLLFKRERENYVKYWSDIHPFVKYGCMREDKFHEKVNDIILFKTTDETHVTLQEYLDANKAHENTVYYANDEKQQSQYIRMFKEHHLQAVVLDTMIDSHFISFLEQKNPNLKFLRVDADITETMKHDGEKLSDDDKKTIQEALEKLFRDATGNEKLKISVEALKSESTPAVVVLSEQSRRFREMSRSFGGGMDMKDLFPNEETLVLNSRNALVQGMLKAQKDASREADVKLCAQHLHDLAMLGHKPLDATTMGAFIERSNLLLQKFMG